MDTCMHTTCTQAHARMHISTHMHSNTQHACKHMHMCTLTYVHAHAHTNIHTSLYMHLRACTTRTPTKTYASPAASYFHPHLLLKVAVPKDDRLGRQLALLNEYRASLLCIFPVLLTPLCFLLFHQTPFPFLLLPFLPSLPLPCCIPCRL